MLATTQSQIIFDAKHKKAQTYKPAKTCDHKHHQEKHISPWSLYILIQFPLPTFHMGLNMLKKDNLLCFHLVRHVHFSDDFWSPDQYVNEIHPNLVFNSLGTDIHKNMLNMLNFLEVSVLVNLTEALTHSLSGYSWNDAIGHS